MKAFINLNNNICQCSEKNFRITGKKKNKNVWSYSAQLEINLIRFIKRQACSIFIELYKSDPNLKPLTDIKYLTDADAVRSQMLKEIDQINKHKKIAEKSRLLTFRQFVDIKNLVVDINKIYSSTSDSGLENFLKKRQKYSLDATGDVENQQIDIQVENFKDLVFESECYGLIRKDYTDPGSILRQMKSITKPASRRKGVHSSKRQNSLKKNQKEGFEKRKQKIISEFVENASDQESTKFTKSFTPVEKTTKHFKFELDENKINLDGIFYAKIEIRDKQDNAIQVINLAINHLEKIKMASLYLKPPKISCFENDKKGQNILFVKKADSLSEKFAIFKKEISSHSKPGLSTFEMVGTYEFNDRNFTVIRDTGGKSYPTVYRVVPIDTEGEILPYFNSVVAKPAQNKKTSISSPPLFLSTYSLDVDNGISIFLEDIPSDVVSISVYRRNLTTLEVTKKLISVEYLGTLVKSIKGFNSNAVFKDLSVKHDNFYEYSFEMYFKNGAKSFSSETLLHKKIKNDNQVVVNIDSLVVDTVDGELDLSFRITTNKEKNRSESDLVRSIIEKSNVSKFFNDEDANLEQKENLNDLISFRITRRDLTDNSEITYTQSDANEIFLDSTQSEKSKVSRISSGRKYLYKVRVHKIKPEVAFRNSRFEAKSRRTGKKYLRFVSKFLNEETLSSSTLRPFSNNSSKKKYDDNPFLLGETGSHAYKIVDLSAEKPVIKYGKVEKNDYNEKLIQWEISDGDINLIDSFIISTVIEGVEFPLYSAFVGNRSNNNFQYLDNYTNDVDAVIDYFITPIYNDYTVGKKQAVGTIISETVE